MSQKAWKEKNTVGKVFSIIGIVLTVIIAALAVYIMINAVVAKKNNKPVNLFGVSVAIVMSPSMEPEIMTGDLIVFKDYDFGSLREGDNIVFVGGTGFGSRAGEMIVHKVYSVTDGGVITKGVNESTNPSPDKDLVTEENFIGLCTSNSAFWGKIFTFISKYGILLIIAFIAVPIIVTQIIKIVKLSKSKSE